MNNKLHFLSTCRLRGKFHFLIACVCCTLIGNSVFASAEKDSASEGPKHLPTLSLGVGVMTFLGDVGYSHLNQPLIARGGFQAEIQQYTSTGFSYSLFLLSGKVFGNEQSLTRNLNFQTGIMSVGVQFRYDFISKNSQQVLIPFISAGVEYLMFDPKADLKDANGIAYHYWKDGTIRNIEQGEPNAGQAVILNRDYTYETDLGDANIDGFGKFKKTAIGFPIGVGLRFKLSGRCSMHFSSVCHFTNTDLIDAVTSESIGSRQGNSRNDKFIFSSVSFRYDFSAVRETGQPKQRIDVSNVDFDALQKEDADNDKIPDIEDESSLNLTDVKVDANGKPIDTDGDGIPDYRDLEPNSAKDALVTEKGVTITEEMIEENFRRDSLAALTTIKEYLKGSARADSIPTQKVSSKTTKIPKVYRKVDADSNGFISPQEISLAIDDYTAGKSSYTSEQFYKLIDFFFKQ